MVPFGTASDGGGSIRTPASFTGLVGLKSNYGRIPTFGDTHLAQNAVVGCLTTTVADTALLLDVMAGPDARDRTCLPAPIGSYRDALDAFDLSTCRVAWSLDLGFATIDPEVGALCDEAAQAFVAASGATLVDRPIQLEDYIATYTFIEGVDKFVGVDHELWEHRLDELDPLSAPGWARLSVKTLPWAASVEFDRRQLVADVATIFDDVDLIVTPMSSMPPFAAQGPMPTEINGTKGHGGHGGRARDARQPRQPARRERSRRPHCETVSRRPPDHRTALSRGPGPGRRRTIRVRTTLATPQHSHITSTNTPT